MAGSVLNKWFAHVHAWLLGVNLHYVIRNPNLLGAYILPAQVSSLFLPVMSEQGMKLLIFSRDQVFRFLAKLHVCMLKLAFGMCY